MINQQSSQPAAQEPVPTSAPAPFIIRPQLDDIAEIVALSLRAWRPVYESMATVLGPRLNRLVYPDWAAGQARAAEEVCRDVNMTVWVAEIGARPAGFAAVAFGDDPDSAEIEMIAVDPDQQNQGIGSALLAYAFDRISAAGVKLVHLGTGGDPGHAPARRTYEKAGFTALPLVRYYKELPAARADLHQRGADPQTGLPVSSCEPRISTPATRTVSWPVWSGRPVELSARTQRGQFPGLQAGLSLVPGTPGTAGSPYPGHRVRRSTPRDQT